MLRIAETSFFKSISDTIDSVVSVAYIDLFHNGHQIEYSFVLRRINLISLAAVDKIQKNI